MDWVINSSRTAADQSIKQVHNDFDHFSTPVRLSCFLSCILALTVTMFESTALVLWRDQRPYLLVEQALDRKTEEIARRACRANLRTTLHDSLETTRVKANGLMRAKDRNDKQSLPTNRKNWNVSREGRSGAKREDCERHANDEAFCAE